MQTHVTVPTTGMEVEFRHAKIEHYLDQAREYFKTARLLAARKPLERVFTLDPQNSIGKNLQESIEHALTSLMEGSGNGVTSIPEARVFPRQNRKQELVMIVDQDEQVLERLTVSLHRYGFNTVSAGTYREAVDLLSLVSPHLIISEVNFEDGPVGFDLYLWVRTNPKLQDVPFLFLATKVDRQTYIAGKRLGVNDFILKPVDQDIVHASIVSCLARGRQHTIGR